MTWTYRDSLIRPEADHVCVEGVQLSFNGQLLFKCHNSFQQVGDLLILLLWQGLDGSVHVVVQVQRDTGGISLEAVVQSLLNQKIQLCNPQIRSFKIKFT